ncbi:MAG: hypothetical protein J6S50_01245 [Oscillospiraceae bacterium]|nr:hypothetical protein [Oscillospiraceae bacterium]MBO7727128.1 hypothetical protein [Oscillospiraceae bacterium]
MTNMQRIKKVLAAILMILCSCIVIRYPEEGFYLVAVIFCVSLLLYGIRTLLYYLTMARHMVGGKSILYFGIIVFDLGIFILTTVNDPKFFIVIYLFVFYGFSGIMAVLQAFETKRFDSPSWKWILIEGIANTAVAILAVIAGLFLRSSVDISYLYAACLFYSAFIQLSTAFRKTAIIFIQ